MKKRFIIRVKGETEVHSVKRPWEAYYIGIKEVMPKVTNDISKAAVFPNEEEAEHDVRLIRYHRPLWDVQVVEIVKPNIEPGKSIAG